jgi:hypothetical protein
MNLGLYFLLFTTLYLYPINRSTIKSIPILINLQVQYRQIYLGEKDESITYKRCKIFASLHCNG